MNKFRNHTPQRTCTKTYASYRSFKPFLKNDFKGMCGYTNCSDIWFGGARTFHIDHFKPKSKYPELETAYNNLVYCCSYVNILKSDDEGDYLDPCNTDLNNHFERDKDGSIIPITNEGKYMFDTLQLGMRRYRIIWMLEELYKKMTKLKAIIESIDESEEKKEYLVLQGELSNEFLSYLSYLRVEQ